MSVDNLENHQVPTWRNEMHYKNVTRQVDAWILKLVLDFSHSTADFLQISELFLANVPCKTYTLKKKAEKKTYIPVSFLPTIKRCVQDIILGFQMFHRGRSSDKMTIRFSLISSVSKNITSTLLHWLFCVMRKYIPHYRLGYWYSNSWYIGNGQLELTCRAHRKLVPKYG